MKKMIAIVFFLMVTIVGAISASNSSVQGYLSELEQQAKSQQPGFNGFSVERGRQIFMTKRMGKRGKMISCSSCHSTNLSEQGENVHTGKKISPLAPSANRKSLTTVRKIKKWLRRNFRDVYNREGTAIEKGDVLKFILSQ